MARDLLGAHLVSSIGGARTEGEIVEVEAYLGPDDPASHAAVRAGKTDRNAPMFGPGGTAYVYLIYGMHRCFNVVTGPEGAPSAVLVRALAPLSGLEVMRRRRGDADALASGPGRLGQALAIDRTLNGHRLTEPPLELRPGRAYSDDAVGVSGRIGITRAVDRPLRYFVRGHPEVSGRPR